MASEEADATGAQARATAREAFMHQRPWFHERLVSLATAWERFQPSRAVSRQGMLFDV